MNLFRKHFIEKELSIVDILLLFCEIDDFRQVFEQVWRKRQLSDGKRQRATELRQAMTSLVLYQTSGYKNLKAFYLQETVRCHCLDFRSLTSYNRFVELQQRRVLPLSFYLLTKRGSCTVSHLLTRRVWRSVIICRFRNTALFAARHTEINRQPADITASNCTWQSTNGARFSVFT